LLNRFSKNKWLPCGKRPSAGSGTALHPSRFLKEQLKEKASIELWEHPPLPGSKVRGRAVSIVSNFLEDGGWLLTTIENNQGLKQTLKRKSKAGTMSTPPRK
jgi:hypothetical protein